MQPRLYSVVGCCAILLKRNLCFSVYRQKLYPQISNGFLKKKFFSKLLECSPIDFCLFLRQLLLCQENSFVKAASLFKSQEERKGGIVVAVDLVKDRCLLETATY